MIRTTLLTFALFIGAPMMVRAQSVPGVDAASQAANPPSYLMCKINGTVRTIRVSKKSNGNCMTTYTKEGVDRVVNESWAVDRCEKVLNNIRENLEKASWKCKDISDSRVSISAD